MPPPISGQSLSDDQNITVFENSVKAKFVVSSLFNDRHLLLNITGHSSIVQILRTVMDPKKRGAKTEGLAKRSRMSTPRSSPSKSKEKTDKKGRPVAAERPGPTTDESMVKIATDAGQDVSELQSDTSKQLKTPGTTPQSAGRYSFRTRTPTSTHKVNKLFRTPGRTPGKSLARTPYRTPRIKTLGREEGLNPIEAAKLHKVDPTEWKEHQKRLMNKHFKYCNLGTMSGFKYMNEGLRKKYQAVLRHNIELVFPSSLLKVKIVTTSCLSFEPKKVEGLNIEVTSLIPGEEGEMDRTVTVYSCWLFKTPEVQSSKLEHAEWFPVMLYLGRDVIHHTIINWLQSSFACYISPIGVTQTTLLWMAGVFSKRECSLEAHKKEKYMEFVYDIRLPCDVGTFKAPNDKRSKKVAFAISVDDVHYIWNAIIDSSKGVIDVKELREYFGTMEQTLANILQMNRVLLHLYSITTSCVTLRSDARLKFTCSRRLPGVINHLMDMFLQICNNRALAGFLKEQYDEEGHLIPAEDENIQSLQEEIDMLQVA